MRLPLLLKENLFVFIFLSICQPVIAQPVISSFSPQSAAAGATVTITGSKFSSVPSGNIVYFGASRALVKTANNSSLTVIVPAGASYQPISVTVNKLTAYSGTPFIQTFSGGATLSLHSFGPQIFGDTLKGLSDVKGLQVADFDYDSKPDVAVVDKVANALYIYQNKSIIGNCVFAQKIILETESKPVDVTSADFDGDGKIDLLVMYDQVNYISLYKNTSAGNIISFAARQNITLAKQASSMAVTDFDADGKPDIAVAISDLLTNHLSIFKNTTSGNIISFTNAVNIDMNGGLVLGLKAGDIDGDGKPDIVAPDFTDYQLSLIRNTSTPGHISFAVPQKNEDGQYIAESCLADFNGDGKPEIAFADVFGSGAIMRNTSVTGTFSFQPPTIINGLSGLSAGDMDGDGKVDMVTLYNDAVAVYKNASTPSQISFYSGLSQFSTCNEATSAVDIDGDGLADIVASGGVYAFGVFLNRAFAPYIAGASPLTGPAGTVVNIFGTNFSHVTSVKFGEVPAASFTINSPTSISAVVGGGTTGDISVSSASGTAKYPGFLFLGPPVITSLSPDTISKNSYLFINGNNFTGTTSVTVGGVPVSFSVNSPQLISVYITTELNGYVKVVNTYGADSIKGFVFAHPPTVTSFSPVKAAAGQTVTINGTGLDFTTGVSFGGVPAESFKIISPTSITAVVGNGAPGNIVVTTIGGTGSIYGFILLPTLTSFEPKRCGAGGVITITGKNLDIISTAIIGGAYTAVKHISTTELQAVPNVSSSSGNIVLISNNYDTVSLPGFVFLAPAITSITPNSGFTGVPVTIKGKNFTGTTGVYFGGTWNVGIDTIANPSLQNYNMPAQSFTVLSDTEIVARVGDWVENYSTTGDIGVQTKNGIALSKIFQFTRLPAIGSISPLAAVAGERITITGSNFSEYPDSNAVYFGPVRGKIINATKVALTVEVPNGATYSKISVTNVTTGLSVFATQYFTPGFKNNIADGKLFKTWTDFATVNLPIRMAIADINNDGKSDVILADTAAGVISIYKNTSSAGKVSFAPKIDIKLPAPQNLIITDFNGDGLLDIASFYKPPSQLSPDSMVIFVNKSNATTISFSQPTSIFLFYDDAGAPNPIIIADLNKDGWPDLLYSSINTYNRVEEVDSRSSKNVINYEHRDRFVKPNFSSVYYDDIDGNGKPDILLQYIDSDEPDYSDVIAYRDGDWGALISNVSIPSSITWWLTFPNAVFSDIDLDGKPDLVSLKIRDMPLRTYMVGVFRNRSSYQYFAFDQDVLGLQSVQEPNSHPRYVDDFVLGDFNGDGKPDIAYFTFQKDSGLVIAENKSTPGNISMNTFHHYFTGDHVIRQLATTDIDGDGRADFITLDSTSRFTVFLQGKGDALPVQLLNFSGQLIKNQTKLNWATSSEVNTAYFQVERSMNGLDFSALNNVAASGNSQTEKGYTYFDVLPPSQFSKIFIYYRLKIVDADGNFTYSNVVAVALNSTAGEFLAAYPNPATSYVTLTLPSSGAGAELQVTDILGHVVKYFTITANEKQITIDLKQLVSGLYTLIWSDGKRKQSVKILRK